MSGPSLYELSAEYREAFDYLSDLHEAGELDGDTFRNTMEGLRGPLEEKAINTFKYARHIETIADARKKAADAMLAAHKRLMAQAQDWDSYAVDCVRRTGLTEVCSSDMGLKLTRGRMRTIIDDEQRLHTQWKREKTTWEPDKAAIKAALEAKREVNGARLERGPETLKVT